MKNVLFVAMLLFLPIFAFNQTDTIPKSAVLQGNNIRATVNSNGLLFHDIENGEGGFFHDDYPDVPLIKSVGFWAGGIDPGGNLKISAMSPENGRHDFIPGYRESGQFPGSDFNYIAKVNGLEIKTHLEDYNDNGVIDFPIASIFSWPGAENPHFEAYTGMPFPDFHSIYAAPFVDRNSDGIYDPLDGDFPSNGVHNNCYEYDIFPNELLWTTFHDLKIEPNTPFDNVGITVQPTIFSYNCSQNSVAQNTVYVNFRVIYNGGEDLDSIFFGLNVDFDLGCPLDDYLGSSPDNESVYVYNASETDEDCGDFSGLNETAPILLCDFAQGPLDENFLRLPALRTLMPLANEAPFPGMEHPNSNIEYYRYLSGSWRDGSPLEVGGDGYQEGTFPTDIVFPDNPNDSAGWSNVMANPVPGNKNFLGATGNFMLQPHRVSSLIYAFSTVQDTPIDSLYSAHYYEQYYNYWARTCDAGIEPCSQFTNTSEPNFIQKQDINLYPNPTSNLLNLDFKTQKRPSQLKIFDLHGKELWSATNATNIETIAVDWLPAGVYFLEADFDKNSVRKKFIVTQK